MYLGEKLRIIWYTKPSLKPYLGFLLIMGGFLAMMAYLRSLGQVDDTAWMIFRWVGGGIIFAVLLPYFWGYVRILMAFRKAEKNGRLDVLCDDFDFAQPIAKGYARLGRYYFFGKGGRNVVAYEEICHVLLHENYAGLQRNQRELHYRDDRGWEQPLCGLPLFGRKGKEIAAEIQCELANRRREMGLL